MDIEQVRRLCLMKKGVSEEFPFDDTTLVFKVADKMFCLMSLEPPLSINIKCKPEEVIELIERYEFVEPGYHMNKKHWITVHLDKPVNYSEVASWIENSYNLVVNKLTKKQREALSLMK